MSYSQYFYKSLFSLWLERFLWKYWQKVSHTNLQFVCLELRPHCFFLIWVKEDVFVYDPSLEKVPRTLSNSLLGSTYIHMSMLSCLLLSKKIDSVSLVRLVHFKNSWKFFRFELMFFFPILQDGNLYYSPRVILAFFLRHMLLIFWFPLEVERSWNCRACKLSLVYPYVCFRIGRSCITVTITSPQLSCGIKIAFSPLTMHVLILFWIFTI